MLACDSLDEDFSLEFLLSHPHFNMVSQLLPTFRVVFSKVNRRMALFKEAEDMVGICGALDATAEVVMAEGDAVQAAELLKEAVKKGKETKMKDGELGELGMVEIRLEISYW